MKITIQSVDIEKITKGKATYSKAQVAYSYNGEPRTQNIMSFANPAIFKVVQDWANNGCPTDAVDVTLTKNAAGYNEWSAIGGTGSAPSTGLSPAKPATPSSYPTPNERAATQVYIVKQSSLANAIQTLKSDKVSPNPDEVIQLAQKYVDFVMGADDKGEDSGA